MSKEITPNEQINPSAEGGLFGRFFRRKHETIDVHEQEVIEHLMSAEPGSARYIAYDTQIEFLENGSNIKNSNRTFDKYQQNRRGIDGYAEEDRILDQLLVSSGYLRKYSRRFGAGQKNMRLFAKRLKEIKQIVIDKKSQNL